MTTITEEIVELRNLDMPALLVRYEELFGRAPRVKHREFLWKRCAWKIQEQRFGGLSTVALRKLEDLIADIDLPTSERERTVAGKLRAPSNAGDPSIGTTIVRQWRGRELRVQVIEGGFEHDGVVYRSLSAIAKAITGTHWNGRLFFGLKGGSK